ncbi:MAG: hypothetical protein A4E44_01505 [Methanosaeta sp. PtaB.Bin018]|jgi:hypothetical protein|nr:MAG: hypothetical protein A4E44_01505 [Methanosaeta sp. PtaB.Bin018]OPY47377.1 MAG: hypothetical protein A4E46_00457 [Methanosaeta sp. PtaU1.Bin016]
MDVQNRIPYDILTIALNKIDMSMEHKVDLPLLWGHYLGRKPASIMLPPEGFLLHNLLRISIQS